MHNKTRFILGASVALLTLTGSALFMVNDASASSRNALSNQLTMARVAQPIAELQTAAPPLAEDDSDEATVVLMEEEFDWFMIAASQLGLSEDELFEALDGGQTIADLATANGVELQAIVDALIAAEADFIDSLLADGEISQEEATEWLAELPIYADEFVNETLDAYFEGADWFQIAADTLGVEVEALFEAESIAAVAAEQGVEVQTVIDAIVIAENAFVDELVASGDITAEEAAEWKAETVEFVTDVVENGFETFECEDGDHEEEIEVEPESEA